VQSVDNAMKMRIRDALRTGSRPQPRRRGGRAREDTGVFNVMRGRNAGGPEDQALYRCACGAEFRSSVSAEVRCPHCGAEQAW
jgi:hypothetical protein